MVNSIILKNPSINSGVPVQLLGAKFKYSWKNLVEKQNIPNYVTPSPTQKYGFENPVISLSFYIPVDSIPSGTMTQPLLLQFLKNKYLDTTATRTTLIVTYATYGSTFLSSGGVNGSIPVEIDSCDIDFDTQDSYQGNVLNLSLTMTEVI